MFPSFSEPIISLTILYMNTLLGLWSSRPLLDDGGRFVKRLITFTLPSGGDFIPVRIAGYRRFQGETKYGVPFTRKRS